MGSDEGAQEASSAELQNGFGERIHGIAFSSFSARSAPRDRMALCGR